MFPNSAALLFHCELHKGRVKWDNEATVYTGLLIKKETSETICTDFMLFISTYSIKNNINLEKNTILKLVYLLSDFEEP